MSTNMVGNTGLIIVAALGAWLLLSVLVGLMVGACLRPRTRIVGASAQRDTGSQTVVRAA
jgi:hypothetical protein